jgi:hypothetical protein
LQALILRLERFTTLLVLVAPRLESERFTLVLTVPLAVVDYVTAVATTTNDFIHVAPLLVGWFGYLFKIAAA